MKNFTHNLAIAIGINQYQNGIAKLKTAKPDAETLADLLRDEYQYQVELITDDTERKPTLKELENLLTKWLPEQLQLPAENNRLLFYFAGHGMPLESDDGPRGFLLPQDAHPNNSKTFLPMQVLHDALVALPCHHLLVILDCCFAGTFRWSTTRKAIPILETIHREHYDRFIRYPAWQAITSAAHNQEALDFLSDKRGIGAKSQHQTIQHSPFAEALFEALQHGDPDEKGRRYKKADLTKDGVITAPELYLYLRDNVETRSEERQTPGLYPLKKHDRGEYIFHDPNFDPQTLSKADPIDETNNPYRGLKPFEEEHARFFFGRQELIETLYARIAAPDHSLTVVLGVSGSGKSSLVKAGLIPYLRELSKPPINDLHQWHILNPIRPGESPFAALARTLWAIADMPTTVQLDSLGFLSERLNQKTEQLNTQVAEAANKHGETSRTTQRFKQEAEKFAQITTTWNQDTHAAKQLLIVEHFETLYALCQTPEEPESQQQQQLKQVFLACLKPLTGQLQSAPNSLVEIVQAWSQKHPGVNLLLVIDQFEELITLTRKAQPNPQSDTPQEWQQFLQLLETTLAANLPQLRIIVTLRSDFEPRFLNSEALKSYWTRARFPVRAMRSDELRQAIEGPALEMALYFEPANLVDRLIDEVGQMPGALPLLSFTLSEFYIKLAEKWRVGESSDRALTIDASFDKEGGVAGSLTRRANEEYKKIGDALGEAAQLTMRRVMLRMLTLEGGETARRRVPESELVYPTQEESDRVKHVVAQLVEARLLVKGQLETGEPYVEPAHDFLVRGWDRLRSWIEEEQENLALMQRLIPAVIDWDKNARLPEFLWIRDPRLAILEDISLDLDSWLNRLETEFVQHSVEQKQNELEEAEERLIDSEERRVNAELREKAIKVEKSLTRHPQESLEHAIQLVGDNLEKLSDKLIDEAQTTLRTVMETFLVPNILYGHKTPIKAIAISDDGETIVSSSGDVTCLWTPQGNQLGQPVTLSSGHLIDTIAISANGQRIVTVGKNDCVRLWNRQGKQLAKLEHLGFHNYAAISADGQTLLTGSKNKILRLWDLNGEPVETFQTATYTADAIAMSANNQTIVVGGENDKICLWNPQGNPLGKPLRLGLANRIDAVAISADGQTVAGVGAGGGVHLWDSQGNLLAKLQPSSQHNAIAISANGQMIVTGGRSETLRLWNRKGDLLRELKHRVAVTRVAISGDGQTIVVGNQDGTVWVWNQQRHQIAEFSHHSFSHVAVSANGQTIVSAYPGETVRLGDGTIRQPGGMIYVWDRQGNQLKEFQTHKHGFKALAVSPDGQIIATGGQYGLIRSWDCQGKELAKFQGSQASINAIAISTDRQMVVSGSEDGIVRVWDIESNGCIECLGHTGQLTTVAISADGQTIVSAGGDHIVRLWSRQGIQLAESSPHEGWIAFVATNADGQIVASAQRNNVVRLWNQQGQLIREFREHSAPIASVAISANGQIILTGDDDGIMLLWNQRGEQLGEWRHTDPVRIVAISVDNQTLLSASGNTIRLWYGGWVTWLKTCCDRLAYYLISKNPEISLMEGVCKLCVVHAWNPANLMSLFLRQGKSDAESRQLTVTFLVMKVRKFARLGKIEEAISAYTEAQKFNDNKIPIDACGELAWFGSLYGYATNPNTQTIIQRACEEAITSEPNVAAWRDSRGLFRALTGDFSGAIEDFQVVVAKTTNVRNRLQRKRWVKALYNRVNPFTSKEIETLIRQQKIADAFDK